MKEKSIVGHRTSTCKGPGATGQLVQEASGLLQSERRVEIWTVLHREVWALKTGSPFFIPRKRQTIAVLSHFH